MSARNHFRRLLFSPYKSNTPNRRRVVPLQRVHAPVANRAKVSEATEYDSVNRKIRLHNSPKFSKSPITSTSPRILGASLPECSCTSTNRFSYRNIPIHRSVEISLPTPMKEILRDNRRTFASPFPPKILLHYRGVQSVPETANANGEFGSVLIDIPHRRRIPAFVHAFHRFRVSNNVSIFSTVSGLRNRMSSRQSGDPGSNSRQLTGRFS
jgi:hypothetical protein